jgi:hypothetical protein
MLDSNSRIKGKNLTPIGKTDIELDQHPNASKNSKTINKKSKKARDLSSAPDTDGG